LLFDFLSISPVPCLKFSGPKRLIQAVKKTALSIIEDISYNLPPNLQNPISKFPATVKNHFYFNLQYTIYNLKYI